MTTTTDAWVPYDQSQPNSKGKGHPVPEPAISGLIIVALAIALVLVRRFGHTCGASCHDHH